ncbi:hypothetical protein CBR_g39685 [Chara braunii]|uniref:Integrase catalytic domain-containing protein n=1 Tax=Chara braunii TaxID=69332 RepID=A0A388LS99_CHABU|nr:hypothetical protein CBR_g39685 [Chara braunii]|eukprot:GBG85119.1 hypothetical protein CBR_g39685 [Chara braunii]
MWVLENIHQGFAAKTEHVRKLVRKNQEWREKQEKVVKDLKKEFEEGDLVLGVPDYEAILERPFIIETDARPTALGGVLIQADQEGKERPLRFESRTLNSTERNYSQFKKEALAVLHCLRIFRHYLFGRRFILRVDPTTLMYSLRNFSPADPTVARWLTYISMFDFQLERVPGNKNKADGLSRIEWVQPGEAKEETPPVDGFLEEDDMQLHVNTWALRVEDDGVREGRPMWFTPATFVKDERLVLKPFVEENPGGERNEEWMAELALAESYRMTEEPVTIEAGIGQVNRHLLTVGRVHYLVNSLLQVRTEGEREAVKADEIILGDDYEFDEEKEGEEFEQDEISEDFREEEYDGFHLEMRLLLSGDKREREVGEKTLRMRDHYVVRGGHLFIRDKRGPPRRVICGRNRQIDVIAALHDGPVGGHRGFAATLKKVTELYFWERMYGMVRKYCESCVSCQIRSPIRYKEPLHPRYIKEVGVVVHLDLLAMSLKLGGYNYIFDVRDNLTGFIDGKGIRTKTGVVLAECIKEYYLRYPFVVEFTMDRGSEFTCREVRELLDDLGVIAKYTTRAHPQANAPVEKGHSTIMNLLAKWTAGKPNLWLKFMRTVFFVENVTVKHFTEVPVRLTLVKLIDVLHGSTGQIDFC